VRIPEGEHVASEEPTFDDLTDMDFWSDHPAASLEDYVLAMANPEMLLGFVEFLTPDTVVHEDRVFLAKGFRLEDVDSWKLTQTFRDQGMVGVQAVMNHVHASDMFPGLAGRVSLHNWSVVAQAFASAWRGHLETLYPERVFVVDVSGDEVSIRER
jgi:hypothetical protein